MSMSLELTKKKWIQLVRENPKEKKTNLQMIKSHTELPWPASSIFKAIFVHSNQTIYKKINATSKHYVHYDKFIQKSYLVN